MSMIRLKSLLFIMFATLILSCGQDGPVPELEVVPGTALIHVHVTQGFNSEARDLAGDHFPGLVLVDSLLKSGPVGVSLVGVDITSLEPQLLILSRDVSAEYAAALAARHLELDPRQEDSRVDLVSPQGYARASVAARDGWTALYTGPAPHVTMNGWLELDRDASLAADEALRSIIPDDSHVTVLLPGNLFGFLALLPLERQIPWWQDYKDAAAAVKPAAMTAGLSWPDPPEDRISTVLAVASRDGGTAFMTLELVDSRIDADSVFSILLSLAGGF